MVLLLTAPPPPVGPVEIRMADRPCDVKLVPHVDEGEGCDVQLAPDVAAVVEGLEGSHHRLTLDEWAIFLAGAAPRAYQAPPPPLSPTFTEPGSPAKVQAMRERDPRFALYHPDDLHTDPVPRAGRLVQNGRNGTSLAGGIDTTAAIVAQVDDVKAERVPLLSGEAMLARLERRLGRPLDAAARAIAAWPWGKPRVRLPQRDRDISETMEVLR